MESTDTQMCRGKGKRYASHAKLSNGLTMLQLKLVLRLIEGGTAGVMTEDLITAIYDDPGGGPEEANSTINSLRRLVNKKLYYHGYEIISVREGHRSRWKFALRTTRRSHEAPRLTDSTDADER